MRRRWNRERENKPEGTASPWLSHRLTMVVRKMAGKDEINTERTCDHLDKKTPVPLLGPRRKQLEGRTVLILNSLIASTYRGRSKQAPCKIRKWSHLAVSFWRWHRFITCCHEPELISVFERGIRLYSSMFLKDVERWPYHGRGGKGYGANNSDTDSCGFESTYYVEKGRWTRSPHHQRYNHLRMQNHVWLVQVCFPLAQCVLDYTNHDNKPLIELYIGQPGRNYPPHIQKSEAHDPYYKKVSNSTLHNYQTHRNICGVSKLHGTGHIEKRLYNSLWITHLQGNSYAHWNDCTAEESLSSTTLKAATWKEASVPLIQKQHKHMRQKKSTVNGLQKKRNNKDSSLQWEFLALTLWSRQLFPPVWKINGHIVSTYYFCSGANNWVWPKIEE